MIRSTVRTEISLLPRRLQMRKPPASGWRFCSSYTSIITGSQALRDEVFGAELWCSREAKVSRSKRPIHSVMVGRETCKNRLILVLLQPCTYSWMTCNLSLGRFGITVIVEERQ